MGEAVGTVSPSTVFANCCVQAGQALRTAPPALCFGTQDVDAPAQEAMQVSATPSFEFDLDTGGRYVDAPYSGSYYLQGGKYYDVETQRLMIALSTNVSTRFAEYKHSVPFNQYAVHSPGKRIIPEKTVEV